MARLLNRDPPAGAAEGPDREVVRERPGRDEEGGLRAEEPRELRLFCGEFQTNRILRW